MNAEHEHLSKNEAALRRFGVRLLAAKKNHRGEMKLDDGVHITAVRNEKTGLLTVAVRKDGALCAVIHWRLQPDIEDYVIEPAPFDEAMQAVRELGWPNEEGAA